MSPARGAGPLVLSLLLLVAAPARSASVQAEGEGRAPLDAAPSPEAVALRAALADAVQAVARGLAVPGTAGSVLERALAPDPTRFAQGYRELASSEADAPTGRVLVVRIEARVDADALAAALRAAGLAGSGAGAGPPPVGGTGHLLVEPLPSWSLLEVLRTRLLALGARHVSPDRAEPGRMELEIESDRPIDSLVEALVADPPPGVEVRRIGSPGGVPAIRLEPHRDSARPD